MLEDLLVSQGRFNIVSGSTQAIEIMGRAYHVAHRLEARRGALRDAMRQSPQLTMETDGGLFRFAHNHKAAILMAYEGDEAHVCIPSSVQGIPVRMVFDGAFSGNGFIRDIECEEGITYLGQDAFKSSRIVRFKAPRTLRRVGSGAFEACNALERIELPLSLRCLELGSFKRCGGPPLLALASDSETYEVRFASNAAGLSAFRLLNFRYGISLIELFKSADATLLTIYNPSKRVHAIMDRLQDRVFLAETTYEAFARNIRSSIIPAVIGFAQSDDLDALDRLLNLECVEIDDLSELVGRLSALGEIAALNLVLERLRASKPKRASDLNV